MILFGGALALLLVFVDLTFLLLVTRGTGLWIVALGQGAFSLAGFWFLRKKDLNLLFYLENEWHKGEPVVAELWEEGLVLLGCLCLIAPGFLSDLLGVLILTPSTRTGIKDNLSQLFSLWAKP
ncbi:MAG: hypothetical protein A2600_10945 [Candidatus Lambdaproteobacteria bacterium RIFOXYD1_FULL_56_27]|uniref:FxsA protein n=1 Tax=Candidatus Lambdaproteobacteria bacterium RIFOXYD2_FULL_56_26 TaxID=1817773 RepID=A0A1F6H1M0_9PROT|nr:MAG: hypothetical protein A2557_10690 [Candidatus Lambdaproteobacteria bacterium RIFOXYD2_FULL_56_26]OGH05712.1 MAG: hypothetical protein A2426_04240 [Candidatus Lambdaproteobacteria bacterium RIFOXYC1_FULL_56_13]OGH08421.1 MAG: hypothetical protein A2600_10945 [Candidatus Lambdaproteobacteria bacterium RIFOXYD1_FULL_56_27]